MASSLPFASSEYVKQWLANTQPEPSVDIPTDSKDSRHRKRKRADDRHQDEEAAKKYTTHPSKQHKRVASSRNRSPKDNKPPSIEEGSDGGGNDDKEFLQTSSPGSAKDAGSEHQTSNNIRGQRHAIDDLSKKYERRPRHKTKTDKYEYKGNAVENSPVRKTARRQHKRSRRKKTGDALNKEFKATNVEQERLTLRAITGPGIFGKGKASALLQTRGLPDLTFSEMTFMTKKRQPGRPQLDQKKPNNPAKKKERSKEISEFFAKPSSEAARPRRTSSEVHVRHWSMGITESSRSPVHSSPARLAQRRETRLGSKNLSLTPRHTEQDVRVGRQDEDHRATRLRSVGNPKGHDIPTVESATLPNHVSTSYYSWSATKSRPSITHHLDESPNLASHAMVAPPSAQQPTVTRPRRSSVTNSSLDRYTKNLLLTRDHELLPQLHREPPGLDVFSLDDLKGLARIAEIEDKYRGTLPTEPARPNFEHVTRKKDVFAHSEYGPGKYQDRTIWHPSYDLGSRARQPEQFNIENDIPGSQSFPLGHYNPVGRPSVTPQDRSTNAQYPVYASSPLLLKASELIHPTKLSAIPSNHTLQNHRIPYTSPHDIHESQHQAHGLSEAYLQDALGANVPNNYQAHDVFNKESLDPIRDSRSVTGAYESEIPLFSKLIDPRFDEGMPDEANSLDDIPELQGLQDAEGLVLYHDTGRNMLNRPEDVYGLENDEFVMSNPDDEGGQHDSRYDFRWRGPTWQQGALPYTTEASEEVFEGFSRPQVLY
jgi:hypothetical protein